MSTERMEFTNKEKQILLWASFGSLLAAGVGFVFRSMVSGIWADHFKVTDAEVGQLFGAGLWPIAIMMIIFSFIVDKVGYKISMFVAFFFQAISVILTFTAGSFDAMWWACIFAGIGHGVVEATINPMCVSIFREEKTKAMNILHAAWPGGIVLGGTVYLTMFSGADIEWGAAKFAWFFMLAPVVAYGIMFLIAKKFPVDERIESKVPMTEMFREFGGLGAGLAAGFMLYELFNQLGWFAEGQYSRLLWSLALGVVVGAGFGFGVKGLGKFMFFFLCIIMVPLATAEIATDGWIRNLMQPSMGDNAGWALVFSAFIMMMLRFFSGIPLKLAKGPLGLLLISSVFSVIGLFALSYTSGALVLVAFVFYAVGQTYYWPSILGFTSERFPKGGALTLNTVSAMGLLTVGIFGFPFLGAVQDHYNAKVANTEVPEFVKKVDAEERKVKDKEGKETDKLIVTHNNLFGVPYDAINTDELMKQPDFDPEKEKPIKAGLKETGRSTLRVAAWLPISMTIGFLAILIWFKTHGGYKKIVLAEEAGGGAAAAPPAGGDAPASGGPEGGSST